LLAWHISGFPIDGLDRFDLLGRINAVNLETRVWRDPNRSCGLHVIRLTTITLRHFSAGERAPSTTLQTDSCTAKHTTARIVMAMIYSITSLARAISDHGISKLSAWQS
jgi:hypothetical protein